MDGRYRITGVLGRGGMGSVYRAVQTGAVERDVAIKVLRIGFASDDTRQRRFEHEIRIISKLRHPNTVRLVDAGQLTDGPPFVVTELLEGEPLDALIRKGPMDPRRVLLLASQICEALDEAHRLGIVHRDLKPGNVFIQRVAGAELAKVLDFGLALDAAMTRLTLEGSTFGTPAYMSPEQCQGSSVGPLADVYSLGAILFECLCGEPIFSAEPNTPPLAIMMAQLRTAPVPLAERKHGASVPAPLADLVMSMISKSPDARPSLAEVRAESARLVAVLDTRGTSAPNPHRTESTDITSPRVVDLAGLVGDLAPSDPTPSFRDAEDTQREADPAFTDAPTASDSSDSETWNLDFSDSTTGRTVAESAPSFDDETRSATDPGTDPGTDQDASPPSRAELPFAQVRPYDSSDLLSAARDAQIRESSLRAGPQLGFVPPLAAPPPTPPPANPLMIVLAGVLILALIAAAFLLGGAVLGSPKSSDFRTPSTDLTSAVGSIE